MSAVLIAARHSCWCMSCQRTGCQLQTSCGFRTVSCGVYNVTAETNSPKLLLNISTARDFCRWCILPVVLEPLRYHSCIVIWNLNIADAQLNQLGCFYHYFPSPYVCMYFTMCCPFCFDPNMLTRWMWCQAYGRVYLWPLLGEHTS